MRVMITGASGFIGSNVLNWWLRTTGCSFVCPVSFRHLGQGSRMPASPRVEVIYHDLRGEMPLIGDVDMILHLASESHVDRSIEDPVMFIENNVSSTLQVLEYARKSDVKLFVQFSTDEVYGPHDHGEWDVLLPSNPYAASKACQEMIAISYWRTYGMPVVITNSNNIIGPGQDPEKFVPKVIDLLRRDEPVTIHVTENGPGRRHYNPVQNVAAALQYIAQVEYDKGHSDVDEDRPPRYLLPGGEELDNLEIAVLIANLMNKKLQTIEVPALSVRPGYDQSYAPTHGSIPDWEPAISLEDCLRDVIARRF